MTHLRTRGSGEGSDWNALCELTASFQRFKHQTDAGECKSQRATEGQISPYLAQGLLSGLYNNPQSWAALLLFPGSLGLLDQQGKALML